MIKICFSIVVLIIPALNILNINIDIERKHIFQNWKAIYGCFFQFIAEKNDRLKFCDNNETLAKELIFQGLSPLN